MPPPDSAAAIDMLIRHLQGRQRRGESRVALSDEARAILNELVRSGRKFGPLARPERASDPPGAADHAATSRVSEPRPAEACESPRLSRAERLAEVRGRAERCPRCGGLGTLRDRFVFAVGSPEADIVLVGEAPGADEERLGEPFVGKAGQLLDKILVAMELARADVYITNIVKWRPKVGDGESQGTANRKPTPEEMEAARQYLLEEIDIIQPKAVVALGGTAAAGLLGLEGSVGSARGRFHDLRGIPVAVTYHPSYLLRNGANTEKRKVWEDMMMVMERVGLPVSHKQRGYFLGKGK